MQKALIVEDNTIFRKTFRDALSKHFPEMALQEATNGKIALKKLDTFQPELIFMDIRLPGQNGLELTEKIKERYPDVFVVILTEYDLPEYREAACFGGADAVIAKGALNISEIAGIVRRK